MKKKVLVTGANGQLGRELVEVLSKNGYHVFGFGKEELNITVLENVEKVMKEVNPDIVLHTAAYTNVDQAESDIDEAFKVNAVGSRNVAVASEEMGATIVYISTDYVFEGNGKVPINEYMEPHPQSVYGHSKLAGERAINQFSTKFFIIRTSWVYGPYGHNFVKTMRKLAMENKTINVVDDQLGSPTYTLDLANFIMELMETNKFGIYHASNSGTCSWYEFARVIFEECSLMADLSPCITADFSRPATRPAYSVLDHMNIRLNGFKEFRHWKEGLRNYIERECFAGKE